MPELIDFLIFVGLGHMSRRMKHKSTFINTIYSEAKIKLSKVPLSLVEISNFKEGWNDFKCNLLHTGTIRVDLESDRLAIYIFKSDDSV